MSDHPGGFSSFFEEGFASSDDIVPDSNSTEETPVTTDRASQVSADEEMPTPADGGLSPAEQ